MVLWIRMYKVLFVILSYILIFVMLMNSTLFVNLIDNWRRGVLGAVYLHLMGIWIWIGQILAHQVCLFFSFLFLNTYYLLIGLIWSNIVWSLKIIQTLFYFYFFTCLGWLTSSKTFTTHSRRKGSEPSKTMMASIAPSLLEAIDDSAATIVIFLFKDAHQVIIQHWENRKTDCHSKRIVEENLQVFDCHNNHLRLGFGC